MQKGLTDEAILAQMVAEPESELWGESFDLYMARGVNYLEFINPLFVFENGKKQFACRFPGCSKKFTRRYGNSESHVRVKHMNFKKFICPCGKGFERIERFNEHDCIKFKCTCGRGFDRVETLAAHRCRIIKVMGVSK